MRVQLAGTSRPSGLSVEPVPFSKSLQVLTCFCLPTSVLLNVIQSLLPFYTPPPEAESHRVEMSDNWFTVITFLTKHNIVSQDEGRESKEKGGGGLFFLLAWGPQGVSEQNLHLSFGWVMEVFCADQDVFCCVLGGREEGGIMLISPKAGFARISKPAANSICWQVV